MVGTTSCIASFDGEKMNIVFGLIGAKGAGKTTAFNAISKVLDVQEITLASKLKDVSAKVFQIDRNWFDSHNFKEKDLEDPVYLDSFKIKALFEEYALTPDFDKHVRPHIGKVLLSPRQIAQYVGTEVLRNYMEDIHCFAAAAQVHKAIGVVTDMRFPNEYEYFAKNYPSFHPIYIQNIGAEIKASRDTHASEAHLKDLARKASVTIQNNGSISEFETAIHACIIKIMDKRSV